MAEQGVRSNYSLCPFEIEMCDDQGGISSATGFIYDQNGELFLITNWHNFAGRDPFTGNPLENQSVVRFPTFIQAKLASVVNPPHTSSDGRLLSLPAESTYTRTMRLDGLSIRSWVINATLLRSLWSARMVALIIFIRLST